MNYIAMALVEHTKGGQPYLFEVPRDLFVGVGGKVVCQTCRGETLGDIVAVFYEEEKTARYLAIACGGSWLCPGEDLAAGNWNNITQRAKECMALVAEAREGK